MPGAEPGAAPPHLLTPLSCHFLCVCVCVKRVSVRVLLLLRALNVNSTHARDTSV